MPRWRSSASESVWVLPASTCARIPKLSVLRSTRHTLRIGHEAPLDGHGRCSHLASLGRWRRPFSKARSAALERLCATDEGAQAVVLLAARRAPFEVRAQAGDGGVGIGAGDFELDVAVELVEADVAADLGAGRPEEPGKHVLRMLLLGHRSSKLSGPRPRSSRCLRSLRRASCKVL